MNVLPASERRLHGRFLWPVRIGWLAVCMLILGMLAVNAPHLYWDTQQEWQVRQAFSAALAFFPTFSTFVQYLVGLKVLAACVFVGTAVVLAWRKSNDEYVLFVSATLLLLTILFGINLNVSVIRYPQWLVQNFPNIRIFVPSLVVVNLIVLFYSFPNGRFTPRWTTWLVLPAIVLTLFFFHDAFALLPSRFWQLLPGEWGWYGFVYTLFGTILLGFTLQLLRFKRELSPERRQQTKWVLLGLGLILLGPLLEWLSFDLLGLASYSFKHFVNLQLGLLLPLFLPLTIVVSILRYRLWDIDLLINRTLVYGVLTAVVVTLYGLSVGITNLLLPAQNNWFISALALGMAVPLVAPAQRRLQRLADRWLPVPAPTALLDGSVSDCGQGTPALRLVQVAWVLLFAFLLWQLVAQFTTVQNTLTAIASEWIVQASLLALPSVSVNAFARYLLMMRIAVIAVFWGTAVLVYRHRRNDNMALFVAFFLLLAPLSLALSGDDYRLEQWLVFPVIGLMTLLPFLFPDGRFIPQSTRWRALLLFVVLTTPFLAYPIATLAWPKYQPAEWVYASFIVTVAVTIAAGLGSQIYRYRAVATAVERQQTKWVLLGLGLPLLWIGWLLLWLTGMLPRLGISEPLIALLMVHLSLLALVTLPLTIGLSILRYHLWDIDLLINRTLVFAGLTLLVAAVYALLVGFLSGLFRAGNNVLLSILATGLIAVLFDPLRRRLQQGVNRLMYGERDDPVAVLARLGERLENTAVPEAVLPALVETIGQTLKLPYVAVTVTKKDEGRGQRAEGGRAGPFSAFSASSELVEGVKDEAVAAYGRPTDKVTSLSLVYQGQIVGQLLVSPSTPEGTFYPAERRLLAQIAHQAAGVIHTIRLNQELQRARERLVAAREKERRQMRRALHDGLGAQLASLALKADAAQRRLANHPETADALLLELRADTQQAIHDIRALVRRLGAGGEEVAP